MKHTCWIALALAALGSSGCGDADTETDQASDALVAGAPLIVSTTIDAPIVAGKYQLIAGKQYTATVVVDAGTITYWTRVEPANVATSAMVGAVYHDDIVIAYTGHHVYTFALKASSAGDYQVAFAIRDRGTSLVYDVDGGVAVGASSTWVAPRIASTTINAPVWNGRYQVFAGQSYQVAVVVATSNVTYSARVEGNGIAPNLHLAPSASSYGTMPQFGANQTFTFTIVPDATYGNFQVAFQLRDAPPPVGTNNPFAQDGGVAITVNSPNGPRITSTTIAGITPTFGQYVLHIGQRYDVVVHVVPGTYIYNASVEVRDPLGIPASANLHNNHSAYSLINGPLDVHFVLTPTDAGTYQVGFQMRDGGTGNAFNPDAGILIVAAAPDAPHLGDLYGTVTATSNKQHLSGVSITLDTGAQTASDTNGNYAFSSVPAGSHTITFRSGSSQTIAVAVTVPAPGIRIDADLEESFARLASAGMPYTRYLDFARGRTLLHVVRIAKARDHVELMFSKPGGYETSVQIANRLHGATPGVVINGGYFDYPCAATGSYVSVGYGYALAAQLMCSLAGNDPAPVLGITGRSGNQWMRIVDKRTDFFPPDWSYNGDVIWDDNHDGVSDVDYAIQSGPALLHPPKPDGTCGESYLVNDGGVCVFPRESRDSGADGDAYWARTATGVASNGDLFLVVADGEHIPGEQGANMSELAEFFRRSLGAMTAMNFDGGGSTQMTLWSDTAGYRLVNQPTAENSQKVDGTTSPVLNFVGAWGAN